MTVAQTDGRLRALETSVEEQKRWNEDIERTMEQIRQSIVARGEQRSTPRTKSSVS
jgi:hypothetical protein